MAYSGKQRVEVTGSNISSPRHFSGHSFSVMFAPNTEPDGYGAYTYVFYSSAPSLETASSRAAYRALVETIRRRTTPGVFVDERARAYRNLFCIPARDPGGDGPDTFVEYDPILGDRLKIQVQGLSRPEMLRKFASSPGPFLVTLRSRLSDGIHDSPLLFADLSGYPADSVADLVEHYMSGFLDGFSDHPSLWKPPVAQRVALVMVYLGGAAGELVFRLLPASASQAATRPAH